MVVHLIVSNLHSQLNKDHIRKIFTAASTEPSEVTFVGEGCARVTFANAHSATRAYNALNEKSVLELVWNIKFESITECYLIQKDLQNSVLEISRLEMEVLKYKHLFEQEQKKREAELKATNSKYDKQIEKLRRELALEKDKYLLAEKKAEQLKLEVDKEKNIAKSNKKAKTDNAKEYHHAQSQLALTEVRVKVLIAKVQERISILKATLIKPPAFLFGQAMEDFLVEVHHGLIASIPNAKNILLDPTEPQGTEHRRGSNVQHSGAGAGAGALVVYNRAHM